MPVSITTNPAAPTLPARSNETPPLRVLKFGGTSLGDAERILQAAERVLEARAACRVLVVASAMAGVTDQLTAALEDALDPASPFAVGRSKTRRGRAVRKSASASAPRTPQTLRAALGSRHLAVLEALDLPAARRQAFASRLHGRLLELSTRLEQLEGSDRIRVEQRTAILAIGERLSAPLLAAAIESRGARRGFTAQPIDPTHLVFAEGGLLEARVSIEQTARRATERLARLPPGTIPVVGGFVGEDAAGRIALLGRGGSDTTAAALGAALGAERIEIWTDVDGVLTDDPRTRPDARRLPHLSYIEAERMALEGARVLHPRSVAHAARAGIPLWVRNSLRPEAPGTCVGRRLALDTANRCLAAAC